MGFHLVKLPSCCAATLLAVAAVAQYQGFSLVETVFVPSDNTHVTTSTALVSGTQYLLEASGTWSWDVRPNPPKLADARWLTMDNWGSWFDDWYDASQGGLDPIGLYVGDLGDGIWGNYSPAHVYTAMVAGGGHQVGLHILDEFVANHHEVYFDNSGGVTVRIFEPVPEPSSLGALACAAAAFMAIRTRRRLA